MKNNNVFGFNKFFSHIVLLLILALLGTTCGGGGSGTPAPNNNGGNTAPIGDLSGTWRVTGTEFSSTSSCNGVRFNIIGTIVQSGSNLTTTGSDGSSLTGTISGNKATLSGTYPDDGGTTVVSLSTLNIASNCNQFSGNDSWSWSDGISSCSGTSTFNGVRLTGSGCGGGGGGSSSTALDTSFGTNGKVTVDLGGDDIGRAVAVDSTDKIIVAGELKIAGSGNFALVRYNTDGTLDNTFGSGGKVITDFGGDDRGRAVVVDSNGKIVLGGDSLVTASDFAIARYNSNGTLDTSFSGNGLVTTDFNNRAEPAMDVAVDSNGKIVAAGFAHNGTNYDFAVARYNSDGSLDTSFNSNGMVVTDLGGDDWISGVAVDSTGKIVVVGGTGSASNYDFAIVRYNSNGSIDTSFGTNGIVIISLGGTDDRAREIAFDSSGRIVIAGRSNGAGSNDFVVMRFNNDGSTDTTFNTNGRVITDIGGNDRGRALVIDSSDRIIVLGTSNSKGANDFTLVRYSSDGSLDTTFGINGIDTIDFGGDDRGIDIVLDSNGLIIVGGRTDAGSGNDFAVARLVP